MWDIWGYDLFIIFYNFIIYSFLGWIYESTYVSVKRGELVNRGFLNGPVIPIYGLGATSVMIVFSRFEEQIAFTYFGGMILATVLEYATSFLMEKLFHGKWWDYSKQKYNLKGRICLRSSIFWGFLSVLMIKVLKPFSDTLVDYISSNIGKVFTYVIILIFMTDLVISVISALELNKRLTSMNKLREEFKEYIISNRIYEVKEEAHIKYAESQISDIIEKIKEKTGDNLERIEALEIKTKKDEIYEKLKIFIKRYQKVTEYKKYKDMIHSRILRAFPDFKSINKEGALKDLKAKLHIKKKK